MISKTKKKPVVLQEFSFYYYSDVFIEYVIKTDKFTKDQLSNIIELSPYRGWNKGEEYNSKQRNLDTNLIEKVKSRRPFGLWVYSTFKKINVNKFEAHADFLLQKLRKKKNEILSLLKDKRNIDISIITYLKIDKHQEFFGLGSDSKILRELLNYCHYFEWYNGLPEFFKKGIKK